MERIAIAVRVLIDLHCHTTRSQDSRLTPEAAVDAARAAGLDAVCFTEHDALWTDKDLAALSDRTGFRVLAGVEVSTEVGHILAYGLPSFDLGLRRLAALTSRARECGTALVLAHPYRRHFRFEVPTRLTSRDVSAALRRRGLAEVCALESGNGATRPIENDLAAEVAHRLDAPTTAGSDAHAVEGVGRWATVTDASVEDVSDLAAAIRESRVRAAALGGRAQRP